MLPVTSTSPIFYSICMVCTKPKPVTELDHDGVCADCINAFFPQPEHTVEVDPETIHFCDCGRMAGHEDECGY